MCRKTISINLIEAIREATIDNKHFNGSQWCANDAEVLEKAARLIRQELPKRYTVEPNSCSCHPETCCCNDWAVYDKGKKVITFFEKCAAERYCEYLNKEDNERC
jgi:hypothetical protein